MTTMNTVSSTPSHWEGARGRAMLAIALLLVAVGLPAQPLWFANRTLSGSDGDIHVGYGSGSDEEAARTAARDEIALSINTVVERESNCRQFLEDGVSKASCEEEVRVRSNVRLGNVEQIRGEVREGIHYVAMRVDLGTPVARLKRALAAGGTTLCASGVPDPSPTKAQSLLNRSPLLEQIQSDAGCLPDVSLAYNATDRRWRLSVGEITLVLYPDTLADTLWPVGQSSRSDSVKLSLRAKTDDQETEPDQFVETDETMAEGDFFYLRAEALRDGFITLFSVSERGETLLLHEDSSLVAGDHLLFPDPEHYGGLRVEPPIIDGGSDEPIKRASGRELYIAAHCAGEGHFGGGSFLTLSKAFQHNDPRLFRFGTLLNQIAACDSATQIVHTNRTEGNE